MAIQGQTATSNGQSALMPMLRATGIDSGEVICPSYTFGAPPAFTFFCSLGVVS